MDDKLVLNIGDEFYSVESDIKLKVTCEDTFCYYLTKFEGTSSVVVAVSKGNKDSFHKMFKKDKIDLIKQQIENKEHQLDYLYKKLAVECKQVSGKAVRIYKSKELVILDRCKKECPNWINKDGMGYSEDWVQCKASGLEIKYWNFKDVNFPEFCPLKNGSK